jgi:hypothetical protein
MTSSIVKQATIAILCLAAGAGSMALLKSKSTETPGGSSVDPPGAKSKRSEGRAVRARSEDVAIGDLPSGAVTPPVAVAADEPAKAAANTNPAPDLPDEAEEPGVTKFENTEDEFAVETRDARWAADSESAIVTIAQRFPQARASQVECRAKHCRMEVSFPGVEEYNALFRGIAEDPSMAQGGMVANVEGNRATIYIARAPADSDSRAN